MELRHYATLVWKWLWLVILCALVAAALAFSINKRTIPVYQATSTLLINQANSPTNGPSYSDLLYSQNVARTYAKLLTEYPVLEETVRRLGFTAPEDIQRQGIQVGAQPVRDTQLIELSVESYDRNLAAEMANSLPAVFIEQNQTFQKARYAQTRTDLEAEKAKVETDTQTTQHQIDILQRQAVLTSDDQVQLSRLQNTLRQYETTYSTLLNSLEQLRLTEAQTIDNIAVTTPARVPAAPIRPRTATNTLLAAIAGAMLALGIAFLIEYLDDTLRTPDQVRELTGLPTLGAILRLPGNRPEENLVTVGKNSSPIAEGYRVLRTNIKFSGVDDPIRTMLITSASPREGKSTTAANLAVTLAQADQTVILVDTDLRRPTIHKYFQLINNMGVTTALLQHDAVALETALQPTRIPNLRVLAAGPLPPNPSELLSSHRMQELVGHLRTMADVVVFDSPPALAAADAAILSTVVDGVLMVVNADSTRRDDAARAVETLEKVDGRILGVVLNKLSERSGGYYSYYYYYSSGDGSSGCDSAPPRGLRRWFGRRGRRQRLGNEPAAIADSRAGEPGAMV